MRKRYQGSGLKPDNDTPRELSSAKGKSKFYGWKRNEGLYQEFLKSGAQFRMTYTEYKKKMRKKK